MNVLSDNFAMFREGFLGTVELTALSALLALVLGTLIAAFRVSPVPALRVFGTAWVTLLRNTPLVLLFLVVTLGLPALGLKGWDSFWLAVMALGCYTSAFVCEAIRSGINTVPVGQAEAARSIGMTFSQTLGQIVLPQAARTAIPPIGSLMIALAKNTAIASGFNVTELGSVQKTLNADAGYNIYVIFAWIAVCYIIITFAISGLFRLLENRLAVAR
ncbi:MULTISPECIES: amino acid ABC transporter permease [Streptomyces]|uniref:Amino acid ABC transporter permease n=2 Tax=Streptomyces albireticuli TaxID=1940 RepID=A0A2A2DFM7_9ACTN|nr:MULTISPECIES: amino acid ABC transporter permease [Streptomyces]MCD9145602.1 amino acid ABC transporter permease [Streptomyces albireticuli]MCD9165108.1 amino acid ABC transporter permease [Streptomyces albireticuli]MCD9195637.1 amino acid ABC transporter permease [Streptomyces albireticuli]PAU50247.1 amino acid ABC transporter permease [Streptomyces albireticuli]UQI47528.1 amino acid ABC transporter permease [Streptomyces sp. HU2014]